MLPGCGRCDRGGEQGPDGEQSALLQCGVAEVGAGGVCAPERCQAVLVLEGVKQM